MLLYNWYVCVQWRSQRSQPDNLVPLCKFQFITLCISLEIDCFHSQWTVNICIAGVNRRAGYATDKDSIFQYKAPRTWHGTDGMRPKSLGLTYIKSFKLASKMAAKLSFQSLLKFALPTQKQICVNNLTSSEVKIACFTNVYTPPFLSWTWHNSNFYWIFLLDGANVVTGFCGICDYTVTAYFVNIYRSSLVPSARFVLSSEPYKYWNVTSTYKTYVWVNPRWRKC